MTTYLMSLRAGGVEGGRCGGRAAGGGKGERDGERVAKVAESAQ